MSDSKFRRAFEFTAEHQADLDAIKQHIQAKTDTAAIHHAVKVAARLAAYSLEDIRNALWLRDQIGMQEGGTLVFEKETKSPYRDHVLVPPVTTSVCDQDQPAVCDSKFRRAFEFTAEHQADLDAIKQHIQAKTDTAAINHAVKVAARLSAYSLEDIRNALWLRDEIGLHVNGGEALVVESTTPPYRVRIKVPPAALPAPQERTLIPA